MIIAHISDLHTSGSYFNKKWGELLLSKINDINPDLIIITGDLTDWGYLHEFEIAKKFIDRFENKKLIIPGNHDARNKGYEIFEELYKTRYPFYENDEIIILGMDSSEPDLDEGHIGRENYHLIKDRFSNDKFKILALHHHIIPIPGTGRERNILIDAGDVLDLCVKNNINIVLSGHKHLPWYWKVEKTYFITAGTSCSSKLKGKSFPSFNVFNIENSGFQMQEINTESGLVTKKINEKF